MRRTFILSVFCLAIISCGQKEVSTHPTESSSPVEEPKVIEGDKSLEGYQLITGSDCMTCHKDNDKLMGPSYSDIANKYTEGDIDQLASKIIEGSTGVWGDFTMPAHDGLSKEDAKKMVAYIMSMKK